MEDGPSEGSESHPVSKAHYLWFSLFCVCAVVALYVAIQGHFWGWGLALFGVFAISQSGPLAKKPAWYAIPGVILLGSALVQLAT